MDIGSYHYRWTPGDPGRPVLLLLHGTGGDEASLFEIGEAVAPGSGLLGVRGKVSEHGQNRYFARLSEGVFDMPDLIRRTDDLAEWVRVSKALLCPGQPVVALGYSNGANMAASLLLAGAGVLDGAVMLRPNNPRLPEPGTDLTGTTCLVLSGATDPLCPPDDGASLTEALHRLGSLCEYRQVQTDHRLSSADIELAARFIAAHWPLA